MELSELSIFLILIESHVLTNYYQPYSSAARHQMLICDDVRATQVNGKLVSTPTRQNPDRLLASSLKSIAQTVTAEIDSDALSHHAVIDFIHALSSQARIIWHINLPAFIYMHSGGNVPGMKTGFCDNTDMGTLLLSLEPIFRVFHFEKSEK